MEKRAIGSLSVSLVGLGCNNFGIRLDQSHTTRVVEAALDAGINFFDTADIYGGSRSEEFLGRALAGRRSTVIIATKFGMPLDEQRKGAHPAYIARAVEDSLRRLGTDYIDLYQLHRPDPEVPIADTLGALDQLVRAGKVREIGCSNFSVAQLREAQAASAHGGARFVSLQNEYSLLERQPEDDGVLAECSAQQLGFLPYFPLASGLLTGKYANDQLPEGARLSQENSRQAARFLTRQRRQWADALATFAQARGHTLLELALSWLASNKVVASVIAGATRAEQIYANAGAIGWQLDREELAEIDRIAPPPSRRSKPPSDYPVVWRGR
ncbi:MAG TPA: aldo/keto reductase [Polyangiales bacterium]